MFDFADFYPKCFLEHRGFVSPPEIKPGIFNWLAEYGNDDTIESLALDSTVHATFFELSSFV